MTAIGDLDDGHGTWVSFGTRGGDVNVREPVATVARRLRAAVT